MRQVLGAFARNTVFANILLVTIILAGLLAAYKMVRETFPEFSLDMITVTVVWPGADPQEVEEGICQRIEEAIEGIEGIKLYNATAAENMGTVVIEVFENYDVDDVKERVRNEVDAISTFPQEAEKPVIEELLLRYPVLQVALGGEGFSERQLKEWAERVKDELRTLPEVSQVQIFGAREYEIAIEVSEERLRQYGLTFDEVARAVSSNSLNLSGGTMRAEGEEIRLRTQGRKYTGEELATIVVRALPDGTLVTLDRIAHIRDGFTEDPIISRFNGAPTLSVSVLKTTDEDTLAIDRAVTAFVEKKQDALPPGATMTVWGRQSNILQARIDLLLRNGVIGLLLVFAFLWLFLDIRLSFWAGMGIPISIAGALAVMWAVGATINMISLFGLIMVLGIIVDDAIVVGEAIYVARKNGAPAMRAAVDGVCEVGLPIIGAVTTTIVAFAPLAFVGGIMGKFIAILPVVVIACLTISLVECLILLPAHLNHLPNPNQRANGSGLVAALGRRLHGLTNQGLEWFVDHVYTRFLAASLRWRFVSLAVAIAILLMTLGLANSGILKFEMLPDLDSDIMRATIEFPNGTPLAVTESAIADIEQAVRRLAARTETISGRPLLENVFSLVGQTISDDRPERGNHVGSVQVEMLGAEYRGIHSNNLMVEWEHEIGEIPGAVSLVVEGMSAGPPGAPIEIWLQGMDMGKIIRAAEDLKAKLATYDGVYQIQHDFRAGKNEMKLSLKPEARTLGLTVADLASQVYAGYFGEEADRIQRGRDDVRVRVRYTAEERARVADLDRIRIRTPQGHEVPLLSVADIEYGPGYASINRTNGLRRVSVTAETGPRANAAEIFADLDAPKVSPGKRLMAKLTGEPVETPEGYLQQLERKYNGVLVSLQGEQEKSRESMGSLAISYPLALLGILVIVATIFRSYLQPFIIMLTVPFGIVGAMLGHLLLGFDLSIMSFFGMVALSGVVVNDAIVLIERINNNIAEGMTFRDALIRGGARRFRAIFLTTLTTCGGLTPLILEKDMQAKFLIPMAISLAAGVAFATLLTLLLIPCLLYILNDGRRIAFRLRRGYWPTREEVEPAVDRNVDVFAMPDEPAASDGGATAPQQT